MGDRGADARRGSALAAARGGAAGIHRARQRAGHPGRALRELEKRTSAYPPAIILVSDGRPTHSSGTTFAEGLQELLNERWGAAAVRLALGVGRDADMHSLRRFIGNEDVPLLRADNPEQLVEYIVWASKAASRVASRPVVGGGAVSPTVPPSPIGDPIWSTLG